MLKENRRINQEWTIQRNEQHFLLKTAYNFNYYMYLSGQLILFYQIWQQKLKVTIIPLI